MYSDLYMFGNSIAMLPGRHWPHRFTTEQAMEGNKTALVLGASGGIGGELAHQLRDARWQGRALKREIAPRAATKGGVDRPQGGAVDRDDGRRCAGGCAGIRHGGNPPGDRSWAELVLPMVV